MMIHSRSSSSVSARMNHMLRSDHIRERTCSWGERMILAPLTLQLCITNTNDRTSDVVALAPIGRGAKEICSGAPKQTLTSSPCAAAQAARFGPEVITYR